MDNPNEYYTNVAESIIQSSTPEVDIEALLSVNNFGRGMDAFSLYSSVYLEIIAYEEDVDKQGYTQREWDRVVGYGTVPKEYQKK